MMIGKAANFDVKLVIFCDVVEGLAWPIGSLYTGNGCAI